tara:strand:+ start:1828 stop:2052 length:225 start_codon:yes stop_codon:yes gene_type:complete
MSSLKYDALVKKYEAEIAEAKAILEVYFTNAAGIGEHPDIIEEMDKQISRLSSAEGSLDSLQKLVTIDSEEEGE